ncbi:hypothetical protein Poli38472_002911 [Pythium oligandrum]|uniref:Temptin Cys/Cys disulfide domain-containing protein n=1 Tax=Pythium oligandrum TaxID=41045 RepID=A0A8K1FCA6_PYTOL|nr:hypothetical protein Poli38472_002911 [Pythium oligandrum]|eukprot:TMW56986.1 hypothetical protein Poli38472_002911 [Pythium oligandrum]
MVATCMPLVVAREQYVSRLPNGGNVKDVRALGHKNPNGGGGENQFGKDFDNLGDLQWSSSLCAADSDDDGQTNGQELGDPCCMWTKGGKFEPLWVNGVSDPGDASSKSDASLWTSINCSNLSASTGIATITDSQAGALAPLVALASAILAALMITLL